MAAIASAVAEKFCMLCNRAFESWASHREWFDDNPRAEFLKQSAGAEAYLRLREMSHEFTLLQIAKLHDPAVVSGRITLSIEYVVTYGAWSSDVAEKLRLLNADLTRIGSSLRVARNKVLSHNDFAAVMSEGIFGEFEEGGDVEYFRVLQEFVNVVHAQVIGGPYPFDDLVKSDVSRFMSLIKDS